MGWGGGGQEAGGHSSSSRERGWRAPGFVRPGRPPFLPSRAWLEHILDTRNFFPVASVQGLLLAREARGERLQDGQRGSKTEKSKQARQTFSQTRKTSPHMLPCRLVAERSKASRRLSRTHHPHPQKGDPRTDPLSHREVRGRRETRHVDVFCKLLRDKHQHTCALD